MHRTISGGEEPELLNGAVAVWFFAATLKSVKPREGVPSQPIEKADPPHVR